MLSRANAVCELFKTIKIRNISYLGHVFRGDQYKILQIIIKTRIEGLRGIGQKQMSLLKG